MDTKEDVLLSRKRDYLYPGTQMDNSHISFGDKINRYSTHSYMQRDHDHQRKTLKELTKFDDKYDDLVNGSNIQESNQDAEFQGSETYRMNNVFGLDEIGRSHTESQQIIDADFNK